MQRTTIVWTAYLVCLAPWVIALVGVVLGYPGARPILGLLSILLGLVLVAGCQALAGLSARAGRGAQLQRLLLGRHTSTYFLVEGVALLILGVVFVLRG